jgi:hypothetical protein
MKRTVNGMIAYGRMLSTKLPERTKTYTPISHKDVVSRVRTEITAAGYVITGEDYKCTQDGTVAIGNFKLNYKADPDIELSANFMNSYNKQYAFRFSLGGLVKVCMNGMMLSNSKFGAYKRVHKGAADILAAGKIAEFIKDSDEYWSTLVEHKEMLKSRIVTKPIAYIILGRLFFEHELLTTMQLNMIKKEIEKPSFEYNADTDSAWVLYNHITLALKEAHPSTWMDDQIKMHDVFCETFGIDTSDAEDEEDMVVDVLEEELVDNLPF